MKKQLLLSLMSTIILIGGCFVGRANAIEFTSQNFIVRDPVLGAIGGYSSGSSFQLFQSGDLVFTGRGSDTFLGRFGFLYFPFVTEPTLSATAGDAQVQLDWAASSAGLGFTVSGYEYGLSTSSGGPYTYTNVGNVITAIVPGLTNGTQYHFVVRTLDAFGNAIITSNEANATPSGPGGPGGGGSSGSTPGFIGVQFSGLAYPHATVSILKNAVQRAVTKADLRGFFSTILQESYDRTILYTLYADDLDRERSLLLNYPLVVEEGANPVISNVKFAPTFSTNKIAVKRGSPIEFSGFALPSATLEFELNGPTDRTIALTSQISGRYALTLATAELPFGDYEIKVHYPGDSRYSLTIRFAVGSADILKTPETDELPGDCNVDRVIDLKDFSILAFWYGKDNPPACIDTNHDGIINLVDFSILAFHWTG